MILSLGFIAFVTLLHIVGKVHMAPIVPVAVLAKSAVIGLVPAH